MKEFKAERPNTKDIDTTDTKKIIIKCVVCNAKVALTPEEIKKNKNYDQYIIRHELESTVTVLQAGTLCDECLIKPLEQRIIRKKN